MPSCLSGRYAAVKVRKKLYVTKAARAVLGDHAGDVDALKEAEPWLFADTPAKQQGGKTGLPNAGAASDEGKTMKRWREIAGIADEE